MVSNPVSSVLKIRKISPNEINKSELFELMFDPLYGAFYPESSMVEGQIDFPEYLEDTIFKEGIPKTYYVMEDETGKMLGFITFASRVEDIPVLVLEDMCLDKSLRGRGEGTRFAKFGIEEERKTLDGRPLVAYVSMQGNPNSPRVIRFFEYLGFEREKMIRVLAKKAPPGRSTVDYMRMIWKETK